MEIVRRTDLLVVVVISRLWTLDRLVFGIRVGDLTNEDAADCSEDEEMTN